jgi:hypothetical protein
MVVRRLRSLLWVSALLLSCREKAAPNSAPPVASPAVPATPAPAPAPSASVAASATAASEPLGLSEVPKAPSKESATLNSDGLRAHRAKDYAKSAELFQRAFASDPSYSLARFNAATALARLGRLERVDVELRALLSEDLPEYAHRLIADPDLEAFRAAPSGRALLAELPERERRWLAAAAEGVAGQLWRRHEPSQNPENPETDHQRPEFVRFGAYNARLGRFLPLVKRLPDALAALVDTKSGAAAVLRGRVSGCTADLCPRINAMSLLVLPRFAPGDAAAGFQHAAPDNMPEVVRGDHLEIELGGGSARWRIGEDAKVWFRVASKTPLSEAVRQGEQGERLGVGPYGSFLAGLPPGFAIEKNELVGAGIKLGLPPAFRDRRHQLALSSDGKQGVLVSSRASCRCERDGAVTELSYIVSRVSFEKPTIEQWLVGKGSATARYGGDGSLYLQRGDGVERFAPGSDAAKPTLAGFALVSPVIDVADCCGL